MEVNCMCCDKYCGESKHFIEFPLCKDCTNILKERHGEVLSLAYVFELRKEKGLKNENNN